MDEYYSEEFLEEVKRRIEAECKEHDWIRLEPGVEKCSICESLLFDGDNAAIDFLTKYLLGLDLLGCHFMI